MNELKKYKNNNFIIDCLFINVMKSFFYLEKFSIFNDEENIKAGNYLIETFNYIY